MPSNEEVERRRQFYASFLDLLSEQYGVEWVCDKLGVAPATLTRRRKLNGVAITNEQMLAVKYLVGEFGEIPF